MAPARYHQAKRQRKQKIDPATVQRSGDEEDDFALDLPDHKPSEPAEGSSKRNKAQAADADVLGDLATPKRMKKHKKAIERSVEVDTHKGPSVQIAGEEEKVGGETKSRKKRSSASELASKRQDASGIAASDPSSQAEWLWRSYTGTTGATFLERAGLDGISLNLRIPLVDGVAFEGISALADGAIVSLGEHGSLEERLGRIDGGRLAGELAGSCDEKGSPLVILIAASAVTANGLGKGFQSFAKVCRIAKLFAKHFKVEEQQKDLQRPVTIAVGTPNRLAKLADLGSLKLARLKLILIDVGIDLKQRTILEIPEVRADFWGLYRKHLQSILVSGSCKIALLDGAKLLR